MYGPNSWPANTRLQLTNVPWDSQYRDLVSWDNATRTAWFDRIADTHAIVLTQASYAAMSRPIRLPLNIDIVTQYNYVRVTNQNESGFTRDYFYFIVGADYVTPGVTHAHLMLDEWQTFHNDVEFKQCYIERGHVGMADFKSNVDGASSFGQALLTLPEGLDTGSQLPIMYQQLYELCDSPTVQTGYAIVVTSTIDLRQVAGTPTDPRITPSTGDSVEIPGDAANIYYFDSVTEYKSMLGAFSTLPWQLQGIINVTAIPKAMFDAAKISYPLTPTSFVAGQYAGSAGVMINCWIHLSTTNGAAHVDAITINNFRDYFNLPTRYQHLKKFLTYPYCAIEVTNFTGQSMVLEPERIYSDNLVVHELFSIRPGTTRAVFYAKDYGASYTASSTSDIDRGEFTNKAVTIENFPQFSVLTSSGLMYMGSNAHSIAYQHQTADWSETKALRGNQVTANQSSRNIGAGQQQTFNDINAMNQSRNLNNVATGANALIGGMNQLGGGNVAGALTSGVQAAVNIGVNDQNFNIQSNRAQASRDITSSAQTYMRDTNKDFSDYAAQGDYENAIAGINAKVQDAQIQSPGVHGATGGDTLMMWYGILSVGARFRQITQSAMRSIGEYWLRFGYFVQLHMTPPSDLHVMSKFTYWKMKNTYIRSVYAPESTCNTIRGIFERGTTVWRNPDDIGVIDYADNEPVVGNYLNLKAPYEEW